MKKRKRFVEAYSTKVKLRFVRDWLRRAEPSVERDMIVFLLRMLDRGE